MKKKSPVDELQSLFNAYEEKMKLIIEREIKKGIDNALKETKSGGKTPHILNELIEELQLDPNPISGKYRPASGDYKQFVYWIVNNNYDEILTENNFFTFIHCTIKEENVKRYFREARDEKK
jgi:hypothetical protein